MENKIISYLKMLPEPYASKALLNYDPKFHESGVPVENANDAIGWAFDWEKSPEGEEYWMQLRRHLEDGEALPDPEKLQKQDGEPEYTEGICGDGVAILKDGVQMTISEILTDLKSKPSPTGFVIFIDEVQELINQYNNKQITIGKVTEVLNEKATGVDSMELIKRSMEKKHCVAPDVKEVFEYASLHALVSGFDLTIQQRGDAKRELGRLLAWKESAMKILSAVDDQEIGKLLGVPIGYSISENLLEKIKEYGDQRANKALETFSKEYELTVGGSLMMRIRINESGVEVVGAIDGYGHSIADQISVEEITDPKNLEV